MWAPFKKLFAKSKSLRVLFGEVVFETPTLQGQSSRSVFQWRLKKSLDDRSIVVSLKLVPDGYAGPEGLPTNYIDFDLATAEKIRTNLDACIAAARQLAVKP